MHSWGLSENYIRGPNAMSIPVNEQRNAVVTSVNSAAANTNLLAARRGRVGASVYNASSAILYLKLGTTATTSDYSVQLAAGAYYEVPFGYNGNIDGIWSAANGAAKITEVI